MVRLAPPVLWGDAHAITGDTTWVIVNNGVGTLYPVHINHFDTNGTIVNYYWNEADASLGRMTATDTIMRPFSVLEMNNGLPIWIYGRDDDSLTRGGKFIVYADSVPPKPSILPTGGSGSPVSIFWSGKDAKDQNATLYQILLLKGTTEPALSDSLFSFKAGSTFTSGSATGNDYRYDFTPPSGNGTYHFKVVAKDARGSITVSNDGSFFY